jgi:type IV secretory pathway TrbD component
VVDGTRCREGLAEGAERRVVIVAHPAIMTLAVVATGNHYLLDALAGATIALVALALVRRAQARRDGMLLGSGIGGTPRGSLPCGA